MEVDEGNGSNGVISMRKMGTSEIYLNTKEKNWGVIRTAKKGDPKSPNF